MKMKIEETCHLAGKKPRGWKSWLVKPKPNARVIILIIGINK